MKDSKRQEEVGGDSEEGNQVSAASDVLRMGIGWTLLT